MAGWLAALLVHNVTHVASTFPLSRFLSSPSCFLSCRVHRETCSLHCFICVFDRDARPCRLVRGPIRGNPDVSLRCVRGFHVVSLVWSDISRLSGPPTSNYPVLETAPYIARFPGSGAEEKKRTLSNVSISLINFQLIVSVIVRQRQCIFEPFSASLPPSGDCRRCIPHASSPTINSLSTSSTTHVASVTFFHCLEIRAFCLWPELKPL